MKEDKSKGFGKGKAIIGIALTAIVLASIFAVIIGGIGAYSTGGQYNIIEKRTDIPQSVLIGQDLDFSGDWGATPVTVSRVVGAVEEWSITADLNNHLTISAGETQWTQSGAFYVDYVNSTTWDAQLSISEPYIPLDLKVGTTSVTSIAKGTALIVDTSGMNLLENDTVKLVITDPYSSVIKIKDGQVFDPITVKNLTAWYGVGSAGIDTTNFDVGAYTFQIKTKPTYACGLDAESVVKDLEIRTGGITIEAEKTFCVELQAVRLTVTGVPGDDIHVASSPLSPHVIFRPGVDDTPVDATNQFNHTIDGDGIRTYSVKFNDTGTFTIKVTVTSGPRTGEYDTVDITVSEKAVIFDVPSTVVIGEKLDIKGTANTGTYVDVFVNDMLYDKLNDLVIADGTFSKEVTTTDVGMTVPGSVMLKAWIDCAKNPGDDPPPAPADGEAAILVLETHLNASLSKTIVPPEDSFEVYGVASSNYVEIVAISPKGGNGTGLDGLYGVSIYTVPTFSSWNTCSYKIQVITNPIPADNLIDINISEKAIEFNMPLTYVIGENITINGTASTGNSVDIAIDNKIVAIDIPIINGTFYTEISTIGYIQGSYKIEGFIDGNYTIGDDVSRGGKESDGSTAILLVSPDLTVNISTNVTASGCTVTINGTATGTDHVDLITISPEGGNGTGLYEKSYPEVPGITNESIQVENNTFLKIITVSGGATLTPTIGGGRGGGGGGAPRDSDGDGISDIDEMLAGTDPNDPCDPNPECAACLAIKCAYILWVSAPGRDGVYGSWYGVNASDIIKHIIDEYCGGNATELRSKTQAQILAMLEDSTIDMAGSDDLEYVGYLLIESAYVELDPIKDIAIGDGLVVTGVTNRRDGCPIVITIKGPMELRPQTAYVENGTFRAVFDTSYALPGVYIVKADDGDGHTDETSVNILSVMRNFYKKIKVDSEADTGNYRILVLTPGMDGVYGISTYKYIDSLLDLDGADPELGAIDVSNKTQEEIVSIIKDATINRAGSDDLLQDLYLSVLTHPPGPPSIITVSEPIKLNATPTSIPADGISTSNITIAVFWPELEDYPGLGEIEGYENLSGTPAGLTQVYIGTTRGKLTDATNVSNVGEDITVYTNDNGTCTTLLSGTKLDVANITARATAIEDMMNIILGNETTVYVVKNSTTVTFLPIPFFDTRPSENPYPSISGTHNGTITPFYDINVSKIYTYSCAGTGGHTEYVKIWNDSWNVTASWDGYKGDWHNITFDESFTLKSGETYNYTIRTGSYPQIHHTKALPTNNGWINCTKFTDANGNVYYDWIPAIRLWTE